MPNRSTNTHRLALLTIALLATASAPACSKKKPSAKSDMERSQQNQMKQMDELAAQIDAEEEAKKNKQLAAEKPPEVDQPKPESKPEPKPEPKKDPPPADKKDGGG